MRRYPHYRQHDAMDCGPSCLQMIARYYGKRYSLQTLRERSFITREGGVDVGHQRCGREHRFPYHGVRLKSLSRNVLCWSVF